jgi:predicted Zn-ribbon and HTH transcriptional regulator
MVMATEHRALVLKQLHCLRCGYVWFPRTPQLPKVCANLTCKSPYWDRPRRNGKTRKEKARI